MEKNKEVLILLNNSAAYYPWWTPGGCVKVSFVLVLWDHGVFWTHFSPWAQNYRGSSSQWRCSKILNIPPPSDMWNLQLHMEQLSWGVGGRTSWGTPTRAGKEKGSHNQEGRSGSPRGRSLASRRELRTGSLSPDQRVWTQWGLTF